MMARSSINGMIDKASCSEDSCHYGGLSQVPWRTQKRLSWGTNAGETCPRPHRRGPKKATPPPYDPVPPSQRNKNLDTGLQELKNYVHLKVAQEQASTPVDFETTRTACRLLFANFVAKRKAGDFSIHAIPDLLEVIRHAESYRLRIIHQADLALNTWQKFYEKESPKQALPKSEADALGKIVDSKDNWRKVYMKVVDKLVGLDLYCMFVSKNWSLSEFMVRLFEYSPSSFQSTQGYEPSPLKFVKFLSEEEEKQLITKRCRKSLKCVSDLHQWLQENHPDGITNGLNPQDFDEIHPPPFNTSHIGDLINFYMNHVSAIYETLFSILPDRNQR